MSALRLNEKTAKKVDDPKSGCNRLTGLGGFILFLTGVVVGVLSLCLFNRIKDPLWKRGAAYFMFGHRQEARERRRYHEQGTPQNQNLELV